MFAAEIIVCFSGGIIISPKLNDNPPLNAKLYPKDLISSRNAARDNFYGTLKSEVERIWALGKHVIFDIDVSGGLRIKRKFPEQTLAIFVKPPSIDELKIRLKKRQTESQDKINMRVAKASAELATAPLFDCIIENDVLELAQKEAYDKVANYIN